MQVHVSLRTHRLFGMDSTYASLITFLHGSPSSISSQTALSLISHYLAHLQPSWRDTIGPECELYMLSCLLHYWIAACKRKEQSFRIQVAALIWSHCRSIAQRGLLTKTIVNALVM